MHQGAALAGRDLGPGLLGLRRILHRGIHLTLRPTTVWLT
jgi:hypothetical protein